MSLFFGVRFFIWQLSNWSRLHATDVDPITALQETWLHVRWAVLGIGIFLVSMVWALLTSLALLNSSRKANQSNQPPPLA